MASGLLHQGRKPGLRLPGAGGTAACLVLLGIGLALIVRSPPDREPTAWAYIGPGAGIALLGSFFAVFSAVLSAVFFVLTWPLRLLWRSIR